MASNDGTPISLMSYDGTEIAGINFMSVDVVPRVGERIHYWQDGTEDKAGGEVPVRRDFIVDQVEHDWRYMPPRNGGSRAMHVHSVILHVTEIKVIG